MENKKKATPKEMAKDILYGKELVVLCDENGNCNGCYDCCSMITPVSPEEFKILKRKVSKKHINNFLKRQLTLRNKGEDGIDATCLFSIDGKCSVYSLRPTICKEFHCREDLRQLETDFSQFKGKIRFIFEVLPKELQYPFQNVIDEALAMRDNKEKKCILEK